MHRSESPREYTERRPSRQTTTATSSRSLRLTFFVLTSIWGFTAGVAGVLAAIGLSGQSIQTTPVVVLALLPPLLVGLAGAWILAGAYQEAKRRRTRSRT